MNRFLFAFLALFVTLAAAAADSAWVEAPIVLHTASGDLHGTLMQPAVMKGKVPVALLIAGSGPTDRNGNSPALPGANNSLRYLAQGLAARGIATLRYDKRGIAESGPAMKKEDDLRFDDYVSDARGWLELLKKDTRFNRRYVIGHSEGSLIGMLAAGGTQGFVSIAGAGFPVDSVLRRQLAGQPAPVRTTAFPILDSLKSGHLVKKVHPMLFSLFRPSVQPYMISWLRHDPRSIVAALRCPVLLLQGDNDLQALVEDAQSLKAAQPGATLVLIPQMNHVLKLVPSKDPQENINAYSDPALPVAPQLLEAITTFIRG